MTPVNFLRAPNFVTSVLVCSYPLLVRERGSGRTLQRGPKEPLRHHLRQMERSQLPSLCPNKPPRPTTSLLIVKQENNGAACHPFPRVAAHFVRVGKGLLSLPHARALIKYSCGVAPRASRGSSSSDGGCCGLQARRGYNINKEPPRRGETGTGIYLSHCAGPSCEQQAKRVGPPPSLH